MFNINVSVLSLKRTLKKCNFTNNFALFSRVLISRGTIGLAITITKCSLLLVASEPYRPRRPLLDREELYIYHLQDVLRSPENILPPQH